MRSSDIQLRNRGYIYAEDTYDYTDFSKTELLELLKSKEAYKRTIAVNLLSNKYELDNDMINLFCSMLLQEKKLYTKIELCNALLKASVDSAKTMVNYWGFIGNNQYKELPDKEFNKKSYPLPRDIIARTLAHMGVDVLPELTKILKTDNINAIREVIDSIGVICFYSNTHNESVLNDLMVCFDKYIENDIVRWKIVRAFEGFNNKVVIDILNNIMESDSKEIIRKEAKRSLGIIKSRFAFW